MWTKIFYLWHYIEWALPAKEFKELVKFLFQDVEGAILHVLQDPLELKVGSRKCVHWYLIYSSSWVKYLTTFQNDRKCKIIKGIKSFWVGTKQQTLSQYVNDTLISYKGEKKNLHNVDNLLQLYLLLINGLKIIGAIIGTKSKMVKQGHLGGNGLMKGTSPNY